MALAAGLGSLKPVFVLGVGERGSCWKARVRLQQQLWERGGTQGFCRVTCSTSGQGNRNARRKIGGEKLSKKDILLVEQLKNFIAQQDLPANQLPSIKELTSRGRSDLAYAVRSRGYQAVSRMLGNPRFRRGGGSGSSSDSDSGGRGGRRELASSVTSSVNVSVQVEVVSEQALKEQIEDVVAEKVRGSSLSSPGLDSPAGPNVATLEHPGAATPPGVAIAEDNAEQVVPSSSVGVPGSGEDVGASEELEAAAALASEQEASVSSVSQQDLLTLLGIEDSSPVAPSPPPPADSEERSVPVLSLEQKASLWVSTGQSSSLRESASSETGVPLEEDLVPQEVDVFLPAEVWTFLGQDAPDSTSEQDTENVSPSEQRLQPEAGSTERSVPTLSLEERAKLFVTTGQSSLLGQTPSFSSTEPVVSGSLSKDLAVGQEAAVSLVSAQDAGDTQYMKDEAVAEDKSVSSLSSEERARLFVSTGLPSLLEESSVQESASSETEAQQPDVSRSEGLALEKQGSALVTEQDSENFGTASVSSVVPDPPSQAVSDESYVFDLLMYEREMLSASMGLSSPLEESGSSEAPSGGIGKLNTAEGEFAEKERLGQQGSVPIAEQESASLQTESDRPVVQEQQSQAGSDERSVLDLSIEERARLFLSGESFEAPFGGIGKLNTAEGAFAEKEKFGQQGSVPSTEQESADLRTGNDSSVVQELESQAVADERSVFDLSIEERARLFLSTESFEAPSGGAEKLNTAQGEVTDKEKLGQMGSSVPITEQESADLRIENDSSVVQELQSQAGSDEKPVLDLSIEERARLFLSTESFEAPFSGISRLNTAQGEFAEKQKLGQQGHGRITEQESSDLRTESDSPVVQELQSQAGSDERPVLDLSIEERARFFLSSRSFEAPSGDIGKLNTTEGESAEKQKLRQQGSVPMTEQESANMQTERDSPVVQELQSQAGIDERSGLDLSIEERARLFVSTGLSSLLGEFGSLETLLGDVGKLDTEPGQFSEQENSRQQGSGSATEHDSADLRTESASPSVPDLQAQAISDEGSVFDLSIEERARLFVSTGLSSLETASGGIKKLNTGQGELSEKERSVQQSSVPVTEHDSPDLRSENISPVVPDLQSQVVSNERSVLDLSTEERARLFVSTGLSSILQESGRSTGQGEFSETENLGQQSSAPVSEQGSVNSVSESDSPVVSDLQSQAVPDERTVFDLSIQERARLFLSTGLPSIVGESGNFDTPSGSIGKLSTGQEESSKKLRDTRDQLRQKLLEIRKGAEGLRVLRESLRARTEWRDKEETKSGVLEESNEVNDDRILSTNDSAKPETFGESDIASSGPQPDDKQTSQEAKEEIFAVNGVQGPDRIADYDYHADGLSWEVDQPDGVVPEREETIAAQMGPILRAKLQLESALDATSKQQDRDRIIFSILAKQQEIGRLAEKRKELDVQLQEQAQIEIDSLKSALQLREAEVFSLRQELLETRAELMLVQDKVATDIAQAKVELEEERRKLQDAEVAVSRLKNVSVEWWGEGTKVELAGSFNGWQHFFAFQPDLRSEIPNFDGSRGPMLWGLDLLLYPGVYEIKFIVDGIWTIDHRREMVMRDSSVQNNILRVEP